MPSFLPVQPFQETLYAGMCGPASLKMVLGYYGVEKSEAELAKLCGTDPDLGTDDIGIKRAAEGLGFNAEIHISYLAYLVYISINPSPFAWRVYCAQHRGIAYLVLNFFWLAS